MKNFVFTVFTCMVISGSTYANNLEKKPMICENLKSIIAPCWGTIEVYNFKGEKIITEMFMSTTAKTQTECGEEFKAFVRTTQAEYPSDHTLVVNAYWEP